MKATVKVSKLPDTPLPPTKAVRISDWELSVRRLDYENDEHEPFVHLPERKLKEEPEHKGKRGKDRVPRKGYRPWTNEDIEEMIWLRQKGYSHREIAEKLGRSKGNVSNRLKRAEEEGLI